MPPNGRMVAWDTCAQKTPGARGGGLPDSPVQWLPSASSRFRGWSCAALTGAQLANLLIRELTLEVSRVVMWTDSTTVLAWIQSDSCRFKVFVGTRIAEIQELTDSQAWRYVETPENPADDLTRGKTLQDLIGENRWTQGPPFLWLPPDQWPTHPIAEGEDVAEELRRPTTCLMATVTTNHPYRMPSSSAASVNW
ncbi:hypothetical protein AAFF_G00427900 [Aldrovandia affinis]|uniref:Ig-like domain-containing protein n=1 Tax=Aldrovandia affinis TaxID=143900 RepID=A0AAD7R3J9_9TELE|nr:hypothetical protein AAFF_G00427900 [Aldrovandia affinis]